MTPPAPCTGSATTAATVCGPASTMTFSSASAYAAPGEPSPAKRYGSGDGAYRKPGASGSKPFQKPASPVALVAPHVSPW